MKITRVAGSLGSDPFDVKLLVRRMSAARTDRALIVSGVDAHAA
jgi:hypothetical protein